MSGGSYDYLCFKIGDMAEQMPTRDNSKRIAFKELLRLVAKAAHDIEWVDSADYGQGDENAAIDACLKYMGAYPETLAKAAAFDAIATLVKKSEGKK